MPEYNWDDLRGLDVGGQDAVDARQRSARAQSLTTRRTRPEDVRRSSDDLLRTLDLQFTRSPQKKVRQARSSSTKPIRRAIRSRCSRRLENKFDLVTPDKNMSRAAVEGWITQGKAADLLKLAGRDFGR